MQQPRELWRILISALIALVLLVVVGVKAEAETVIDFDDASSDLTPGNIYSSQGINFASGSIPDAIAIDGILTFSDRNDQFYVLNVNAISLPNLAVAADFATLGNSSLQDTLITLTTAALSVSVDLDNALLSDPGADIVRLIALEATGTPDQFRVLSFVEKFDNPAVLTTLTVSTGEPFWFAIFQVTTELEGFDNLRVTHVPEPMSIVMFGTGFSLLLFTRRLRRALRLATLARNHRS